MSRLTSLVAIGLLFGVTAAHGAETISENFDFGLGFSDGTWNFTENSGNNTPTTQGDFTFTPTAVRLNYSPTGPTFSNRTLTDGSGVSGVAYVSQDGVSNFTVDVTGSYDGIAPLDVNLLSPGYQLTVEITQLSIYGARESRFPPDPVQTTLAWQELTSGHGQNSPSVPLVDVGPAPATINIAGNYTQLVWDVPDYSVPVTSLNTPFTRSFQILNSSVNDYRLIDGLEVKGRVILTYNSIAPAEDADFDDDDDVDGNDFLIWQRGVGGANGTGNANGNADDDTDVDGNDLAIWKSEFGTPQAASAASPVPEPAGVLLATLGILGLGLTRSRRPFSRR